MRKIQRISRKRHREDRIVDTSLCHSEEVVKFRKLLGLTTREFGRVFEFSQTSLNALERGKISGKDVLKRLEIIMKFPSVALNYLVLNQGCLAYDKWVVASEQLKERARSSDIS